MPEVNVVAPGKKVALSDKEYEQFVQNNSEVTLTRATGQPEAVKGKAGRPTKRYQYKLNSIKVEPITYKDALQSDDCESWQASMTEEYLSQIENGTWSLVEKPKDKKILSMR